jgi:tetratricopeptide (TPR) repeat protein
MAKTEKEVAYKKQILAKTWLKKGNRLFKLGRHKEALNAFDKTIALDPSNSIGYYRKGNALEKLEQYDSAYAAYLKAQNIDPDNKTLHHHMGICLLKLEKFKQAYETLKKALQYYPCDLMILEHLRFALREVKDKKDEEELQDRMEEMISNEATSWQDKVNKLIEYKFFTEAKQILDEIIEQDPSHPDLDYWKELLFDSVEELDCYELEPLEREIKSFSSDPEDEVELADEYLNKALENPNDVGCLVEKGEQFTRDRDYDDAFECFNKAIALKPDDYNAWFCLGHLLNICKSYRTAIHILNRALLSNHSQAAEGFISGIEFSSYEERNINDDLAALQACIEALKLKPNDLAAQYIKQHTLHCIGNYVGNCDHLFDINGSEEIKEETAAYLYERAKTCASRAEKKRMLRFLSQALILYEELRGQLLYEKSFQEYFSDEEFVEIIGEFDEPF